jgi:enterochelin esterase family protein
MKKFVARPFGIMPMCTSVVLACLLAQGAYGQRGFTSPVVSPEVAADRTVTFRLQAPDATEVRVRGSFVGAGGGAMTKGDDGLWTLTVGPLEPDLYDYSIGLDGVVVLDPNNTHVEIGAYWFHSLLEVPGDAPAFYDPRDVPHGVVHEHWYRNAELGTTRRVRIYTPPGYDPAGAARYPVLYLLHGYGDDEETWVQMGRAQFIMDNLIAEKKAAAALIAMPYGHAAWPIGRGGGARIDLGGDRDALEADLQRYVIPLVEEEYRARADRNARAIAGLSMGGYEALTIGLRNGETFGWVAGFSAALRDPAVFDDGDGGLLAARGEGSEPFKLIWIGCGGADGLAEGNRRFSGALTGRGIAHEFVETPGYGHTWQLWRVYLRDLLPKLFVD